MKRRLFACGVRLDGLPLHFQEKPAPRFPAAGCVASSAMCCKPRWAVTYHGTHTVDDASPGICGGLAPRSSAAGGQLDQPTAGANSTSAAETASTCAHEKGKSFKPLGAVELGCDNTDRKSPTLLSREYVAGAIRAWPGWEEASRIRTIQRRPRSAIHLLRPSAPYGRHLNNAGDEEALRRSSRSCGVTAYHTLHLPIVPDSEGGR
jgi:hypothetical protein